MASWTDIFFIFRSSHSKLCGVRDDVDDDKNKKFLNNRNWIYESLLNGEILLAINVFICYSITRFFPLMYFLNLSLERENEKITKIFAINMFWEGLFGKKRDLINTNWKRLIKVRLFLLWWTLRILVISSISTWLSFGPRIWTNFLKGLFHNFIKFFGRITPKTFLHLTLFFAL